MFPREEMAMTWTTFHHRGDVLRAVTRTADERRDGILPMDVAGVPETFGDELSLLGALQLRWHTRLSGHIEREMLHQPMDLDDAVVRAWHAAADELPGTRAILDHYREAPLDARMEHVVATASAKEHVLMAAMAGRSGPDSASTEKTGRQLEERARATYRDPQRSASDVTSDRGRGVLGRIRARVPA
jgi:hypothetical protein